MVGIGLIENEDEILDTLQGETGKTRRDALSELLTVVRTGQYYDAHAAEREAIAADLPSVGVDTTRPLDEEMRLVIDALAAASS